MPSVIHATIAGTDADFPAWAGAILVHVGNGLRQSRDALGQARLQLDNATAGPDTGPQLFAVERLGDVVIGAAVEPGDHVLFPGSGGEKDDVDPLSGRSGPNPTADLQAIHPGQ